MGVSMLPHDYTTNYSVPFERPRTSPSCMNMNVSASWRYPLAVPVGCISRLPKRLFPGTLPFCAWGTGRALPATPGTHAAPAARRGLAHYLCTLPHSPRHPLPSASIPYFRALWFGRRLSRGNARPTARISHHYSATHTYRTRYTGHLVRRRLLRGRVCSHATLYRALAGVTSAAFVPCCRAQPRFTARVPLHLMHLSGGSWTFGFLRHIHLWFVDLPLVTRS